MSRVCFIGARPGDPELLTLKGARLVAGCPAVFAARPCEKSFAGLLRAKPSSSLSTSAFPRYMNNVPLPQLAVDMHVGFGRSVPIVILHRFGLDGGEVVAGTLDDIVAKADGRAFFNPDGASRDGVDPEPSLASRLRRPRTAGGGTGP